MAAPTPPIVRPAVVCTHVAITSLTLDELTLCSLSTEMQDGRKTTGRFTFCQVCVMAQCFQSVTFHTVPDAPRGDRQQEVGDRRRRLPCGRRRFRDFRYFLRQQRRQQRRERGGGGGAVSHRRACQRLTESYVLHNSRQRIRSGSCSVEGFGKQGRQACIGRDKDRHQRGALQPPANM